MELEGKRREALRALETWLSPWAGGGVLLVASGREKQRYPWRTPIGRVRHAAWRMKLAYQG